MGNKDEANAKANLGWYKAASHTRQDVYRQLLGREIDYKDDPALDIISGSTYYAYLQREKGWTKEDIVEDIKKSKEYKELIQATSEPLIVMPPDTVVSLNDRVMRDGSEDYTPIGFTMMWAMWACRNNENKYRQNLNYMKALGLFSYVRILTNLTDEANTNTDYWDGQGVNPSDADYSQTLLEVIDTNWEFGFRTEVTILGSCESYSSMNNQSNRIAHVKRICNLLQEKQEYIQLIEIANEAFNIGLDSFSDLAELVRIAKDTGINVPIAASSPQGGGDEENINTLFKGQDCPADITTIHFARKHGDDNYRHCRQPWHPQHWDSSVPDFFSSNEPRNLHEADYHPELIAMDFANTLLCGGGTFVMHCNAGVRGDKNFWDVPNMEEICQALRNVKEILPANLPNGVRANHHWPSHPFDGLIGKIWPDGNSETGCVRCYASKQDNIWWVIPLGIRGHLEYIPKKNMAIEVYNPVESYAPIEVFPAPAGLICKLEDKVARSYIIKAIPENVSDS